MCFFYFDFRDTSKQHRRDLLVSLITQLSTRSDPCCDILCRLYHDYDEGTGEKPTEDDLIQCLKEMLTALDQHPVFIIMDALDECPNSSGIPSPRELVLDLLKELVDLSSSNLHLCVTSRPEFDIRTTLGSLTSHQVSLHDQSGQKKDIIEYVTSNVRSDARFHRWRDEDKRVVIDTLCKKAGGM